MVGFGLRLQEERLAQGMTVEHVHQRTLISVQNIQRIEAENWQELPADVYVKGYVKRYAKLLGLDGDQIWQLAVANRDRPRELEAPILISPHRPESGEVREIGAHEREDETEALREAAAELIETPKVLAIHLLNENEPERTKPAVRKSRPRSRHGAAKSRSAKAKRRSEEERQAGQLPLIKSRSEPGTRTPSPKPSQLREPRPEAYAEINRLGEAETSVVDDKPLQAQLSPDKEILSSAAVPSGPSAASAGRSASRHPSEPEQQAHDEPFADRIELPNAEVRLRQRQRLQQKRLLHVRRQRFLVSLFLVLFFLAVLLYLVFGYQEGLLFQQLLRWWQSMLQPQPAAALRTCIL